FKKLENCDLKQRFEDAVESKGIAGADQSFLKAKLALRAEEILELSSAEVILLSKAPIVAISIKHYQEMILKIQASLTAFHGQNPLLPGIPKQELRTRLFAAVRPDLFEGVLRYAAQQGQLEMQKEAVRLPGFRLALSDVEETLIARTNEMLAKHGLEFPGFDEIGKQLNQPPAKIKQILYLLVRQGEMIKISDDYFVHSAVWNDLKRQLQTLKTNQKTFSVADFKSVFRVSRKYAIPLLEHLDREGITRRSGNDRIIL
ncbi:MAG TPA: SelB C-terminal domain-containing protein, partial [Acidobacteriota bacterium]|nr:SelB C-terminal domain-containing protein [Acidobacteriota bacterium]